MRNRMSDLSLRARFVGERASGVRGTHRSIALREPQAGACSPASLAVRRLSPGVRGEPDRHGISYERAIATDSRASDWRTGGPRRPAPRELLIIELLDEHG